MTAVAGVTGAGSRIGQATAVMLGQLQGRNLIRSVNSGF